MAESSPPRCLDDVKGYMDFFPYHKEGLRSIRGLRYKLDFELRPALSLKGERAFWETLDKMQNLSLETDSERAVRRRHQQPLSEMSISATLYAVHSSRVVSFWIAGNIYTAKLYAEDEWHYIGKEIRAYTGLKSLQGTLLPYYYGHFNIFDDTNIGNKLRVSAILLEHIEGAQKASSLLADSNEVARVALKKKIEEGLAQIHEEGWVHANLSNLSSCLVTEGQNIVFVDWKMGFKVPAPTMDLFLIKMAFKRYGIGSSNT